MSTITGYSIEANTKLCGLPPLTRTIISCAMLILTILLHPPPTPAHVEIIIDMLQYIHIIAILSTDAIIS